MKSPITLVRDGFLKIFSVKFNKEEQKDLNIHQNTFEYMERGDCVSVLVINKRNDRDDRPLIVLNKQFRVGPYIREAEKQSYSSAAGMIDKGEMDIQAAIREVKEETGLDVTAIKRMGQMYTSPGGTTERTTFFIAEADFKFGSKLTPLDKHEGITPYIDYLQNIEAKLKSGEIKSLQLAYQLSSLRNLINKQKLESGHY